MPTVPTNNVRPGTVIDPTALNTTLTNIDNVTSGGLTNSNTKSETLSQFHIDYAAPAFNDRFNLLETTTTYQIASTVYTVLNFGGVLPFEFIFATPVSLSKGESLRAHFDVWVYDANFIFQQTQTIPTNSENDCYKFAFFGTVDGVPDVQVSCEATYSVTQLPQGLVPPITPHPSSTAQDQRRRYAQKCNLSMVYMNTSNTPVVFTKLDVRGRLVNLAWLASVDLSHATFNAFRARN